MPYPGLDISGKVCLITGGTSGIGRSIALGYAQAGARVIAGSTNPDKVGSIKKELGDGHDAVQLDVSDQKSVQAAIDFTVKRFGRLDAMVNAAGVTKRMPTIDFPIDEFERIIRINLTGNFIVAQAAARVMKDQTPDAKGIRGAMVNIASLSSFVALEGVAAYSCSKAAVMALTKNLANDFAQYGIRVNAIAPGPFPTEGAWQALMPTPEVEAQARERIPAGRFGEHHELTSLAAFLLSDAAPFITGECVTIDGGEWLGSGGEFNHLTRVPREQVKAVMRKMRR
jgi:NAD(P)-dependent dehydrogenase (short-subunit alcohol dehydrogenase family)